MLQFVNPIWLAAGIGITIPVIIHLWNVRKGKVLRIGSTLLMSNVTQQTTSSLRLSQWLLLLIRCLMILFLAMLMAAPEWHANKQQTGKGWVLVDKKDFSTIYSQFKSPIDSLLSSGYELHAADKSLEHIIIGDSSQFSAVAADSGRSGLNNKKFSYWSMLRKADQLLPAGFPVYFFSNDKLADAVPNNFSQRPRVSIDLRWQMAQQETSFAAIPAITSVPAATSVPAVTSVPAFPFLPAFPQSLKSNHRKTSLGSCLYFFQRNSYTSQMDSNLHCSFYSPHN